MSFARKMAGWVDVCGVKTGILKYGQVNHHNLLLLVIPGNPGVIKYYDAFMKNLHDNSCQQLPVWGVSHAGHMSIPPEVAGQSIPEDGIFTLEGQIHHKVSFIRKFINPDVKLVLIGHSIGCYMIMKMLNETDIWDRVVKAIHLFPTVERMAMSPQGQTTAPFLKWCRWFAPYLLYMTWLLPDWIKLTMIRWWFKNRPVTECTFGATLNLCDPKCVWNSLNLAHQEMQEVVDLDSELLKRTVDKQVFYYGASDHWCPVEYHHDMVKRFPSANIHLCEKNCKHAFVLEESEVMADWLWKWVKCNANNLNLYLQSTS